MNTLPPSGGFSKPPPPTLVTPWSQPNYASIIQNDPGYMAIVNNGTQSLASAAAIRDAALKSLQYDYNGNPQSQLANLGRERDTNKQLSMLQLAARGASGSGESPWANTQIQQTFQQGKYEAGHALAQQMAAAIAAYTGVANQVSGNQAQAYSTAAANAAANPLYQPHPGSATLIPGSQATYGQPVYKDLSGNLWIIGPDGTAQAYYQPTVDPNRGLGA